MKNRYIEIWKEIKKMDASIVDIGGRKEELFKNRPTNFKGYYFNFDILYGNDIMKEIKIKKKFDYAIMSHIIEHLDNPGLALKNVRRLLKNGGTLIIVIPNSFSFRRFINYILKRRLESYGGYETHFVSFNIETIKNLIEKWGFSIKKIRFYDQIINMGKFSEEIILICKKR
ncbi:MAG: methyltransferase domain-containing protein [Candidatus Nanoarchaeia archaeon]